jgi:hypothetical protein
VALKAKKPKKCSHRDDDDDDDDDFVDFCLVDIILINYFRSGSLKPQLFVNCQISTMG